MAARRIVLAEYFTTEDVTLLFGVRADWEEPKVVEIKQPLSDLRQYVMDNFGTRAVTDGGKKQIASFERVRNLDLEKWQSRFAPFVEPVLSWAEPGDYLYLVPHDVMHYLPLHMVKVEGRHLIERNPVVYTPSASVLKYCQEKRKGRRETILVLGDSDLEHPLWHARAEALEVASLFSTQPYLGQDARKSLVMQKLQQERDEIDILHFACHGKFHASQALKSGILMAPEPNEEAPSEFETRLDGVPIHRYLTAEDFFGMRMHADLVTLSACESGVNEVKPGDELFGLMRALIYAGTPSVVMSLWEVDDTASSILMQEFYAALKAGKTKVEALQSAQLMVRDLNAAKAIEYCEEMVTRLERAGERPYQRRILRDIADLRYCARDYANARSAYSSLLFDTRPEADEYQFLDAAITRCNRMENRGEPPDYSVPVFENPCHWAPFVLVGDWK